MQQHAFLMSRVNWAKDKFARFSVNHKCNCFLEDELSPPVSVTQGISGGVAYNISGSRHCVLLPSLIMARTDLPTSLIFSSVIFSCLYRKFEVTLATEIILFKNDGPPSKQTLLIPSIDLAVG